MIWVLLLLLYIYVLQFPTILQLSKSRYFKSFTYTIFYKYLFIHGFLLRYIHLQSFITVTSFIFNANAIFKSKRRKNASVDQNAMHQDISSSLLERFDLLVYYYHSLHLHIKAVQLNATRSDLFSEDTAVLGNVGNHQAARGEVGKKLKHPRCTEHHWWFIKWLT